MRTTLSFQWANDHENRENLFEYDPIPNNIAIPRVGDRVFLSDAADFVGRTGFEEGSTGDSEKKYSYDAMIVAEVDFSVGEEHYSVDVILRDPNPQEYAEGAFQLYPEYDYDHKGGYTISGKFVSHRAPSDSKAEEDNAV
tara:strand:- start:217 stop:636 length:420 start_codon:yes stop_codon:yes gene_type:complete